MDDPQASAQPPASPSPVPDAGQAASGGPPQTPHDLARAEAATARILGIMDKLRDPGGCPWDREQTLRTLTPYLLEETHEAIEAIESGDVRHHLEELGDVLFQVVFHARMAEEAGHFDFAGIAHAISDKMIRRHPHVFGSEHRTDAAAQTVAWEVQKQAERRDKGVLAGIAVGLPALTRAHKLTARAARVGFDWPDAAAILDKLDEETAELRAELPGADRDRLMDEVGDMLFVLANLARKLDLDPEACLRHANAKFTRRFGAVEAHFADGGRDLAETSLAEMEAAWARIKRQEK